MRSLSQRLGPVHASPSRAPGAFHVAGATYRAHVGCFVCQAQFGADVYCYRQAERGPCGEKQRDPRVNSVSYQSHFIACHLSLSDDASVRRGWQMHLAVNLSCTNRTACLLCDPLPFLHTHLSFSTLFLASVLELNFKCGYPVL